MDVKTGAKIKGIVFDKDGTLFDYRTTWNAWAGAVLLRLAEGDTDKMAALGACVDYDVVEGAVLPGSIIVAGTPMEIAEAMMPALPGHNVMDVYKTLNAEAATAPQAEAAPLAELLSTLRARGLKLGVATNDAEMPALAHLKAAGVVELFDYVVGSDSGYGAKPEAGQLLGFCEVVSLQPEEVVMVGDSLHDLIAGRAAGMGTIGVLTGLAEEPELSGLANAVLPNIGHLPEWLDGQ